MWTAFTGAWLKFLRQALMVCFRPGAVYFWLHLIFYCQGSETKCKKHSFTKVSYCTFITFPLPDISFQTLLQSYEEQLIDHINLKRQSHSNILWSLSSYYNCSLFALFFQYTSLLCFFIISIKDTLCNFWPLGALDL